MTFWEVDILQSEYVSNTIQRNAMRVSSHMARTFFFPPQQWFLYTGMNETHVKIYETTIARPNCRTLDVKICMETEDKTYVQEMQIMWWQRSSFKAFYIITMVHHRQAQNMPMGLRYEQTRERQTPINLSKIMLLCMILFTVTRKA